MYICQIADGRFADDLLFIIDLFHLPDWLDDGGGGWGVLVWVDWAIDVLHTVLSHCVVRDDDRDCCFLLLFFLVIFKSNFSS